MTDPATRHVVVMGVSGSGKSTIARPLASHLGWTFGEGDDFHPQANVSKMEAGEPLTDEDRWPWLLALSSWMGDHAGRGEDTVITCSALRRAYRDVLRQGGGTVGFIHLVGPPEVLAERMTDREDHFMPASLLDSQLATLEPLEPDEVGVTLDVRLSTEELIAAAVEWVRR